MFAPHQLAQAINPWTWWLNASDNTSTLGLVNVTQQYKSGNAELEQKIIREVAGYGMQLGVIEALLSLIVDMMPPLTSAALSEPQQQIVSRFREMVEQIRHAKEQAALEQLSQGGLDALVQAIECLKLSHPDAYRVAVERLRPVLYSA